MYNEYVNRLKEVKWTIENAKKYKGLQKDIDVVELLLALSIFHKRVISNLDAAVKFHGTVETYSKAETISMGKYDFTKKEKNKVWALTITYRKLMDKYGISETLWNYLTTTDFLKNVLALQGESGNRNTLDDELKNGKSDNISEEDLPF
jgi:hypothetical protein